MRSVFTDGSSKGYAVVVSDSIKEKQPLGPISAQAAELTACLMAFSLFKDQPFNLYTDSIYVARIVGPLETSPYILPTSQVSHLLVQLQSLICQRVFPAFVGHIRAHTDLPGPLAEGNKLADSLTRPMALFLSEEQQARHLHEKYHLNASSLKFHSGCSLAMATQITSQCPACAPFHNAPNEGVNPRGLCPNHLWQMDVTHSYQAGRLKFLHVSVDTYSKAIYASLHSGEKIKDIIAHCLQAFACKGIPDFLKTDNGPAYTRQQFAKFCQEQQITHTFGIPHNPTGQAIVERTHATLKQFFCKIKKGEHIASPNTQLSTILYILNFLTVDKQGLSAMERHWQKPSQSLGWVIWKDSITGQWQSPTPMLARVRGAICVFPPGTKKPIWVPERNVWPVDSDSTRPDNMGSSEEHRGRPEMGTGEESTHTHACK